MRARQPATGTNPRAALTSHTRRTGHEGSREARQPCPWSHIGIPTLAITRRPHAHVPLAPSPPTRPRMRAPFEIVSTHVQRLLGATRSPLHAEAAVCVCVRGASPPVPSMRVRSRIARALARAHACSPARARRMRPSGRRARTRGASTQGYRDGHRMPPLELRSLPLPQSSPPHPCTITWACHLGPPSPSVAVGCRRGCD